MMEFHQPETPVRLWAGIAGARIRSEQRRLVSCFAFITIVLSNYRARRGLNTQCSTISL